MYILYLYISSKRKGMLLLSCKYHFHVSLRGRWYLQWEPIFYSKYESLRSILVVKLSWSVRIILNANVVNYLQGLNQWNRLLARPVDIWWRMKGFTIGCFHWQMWDALKCLIPLLCLSARFLNMVTDKISWLFPHDIQQNI